MTRPTLTISGQGVMTEGCRLVDVMRVGHWVKVIIAVDHAEEPAFPIAPLINHPKTHPTSPRESRRRRK